MAEIGASQAQLSRGWRLFGIGQPYDTPVRFATSYLWGPLCNCLIRLLFAVYATTTILIGFIFSIVQDRPWLWPVYFTNLTYLGLTVYFWLSAVNSFLFWRRGKPMIHANTPKFVRLLYYSLHNSVLSFSFVVTIIYWTVVMGPEFEEAIRMKRSLSIWYGISVHVLNVAFTLFEISFLQTTLPTPLLYLTILLLLLALYCGLFFLAAGLGHPVYAQLDPRTAGGGWIALKGLLIAAVQVVVFFVIWGVIILRTWYWEKRRSRSGSGPSTPERTDVPTIKVGESSNADVEKKAEP